MCLCPRNNKRTRSSRCTSCSRRCTRRHEPSRCLRVGITLNCDTQLRTPDSRGPFCTGRMVRTRVHPSRQAAVRSPTYASRLATRNAVTYIASRTPARRHVRRAGLREPSPTASAGSGQPTSPTSLADRDISVVATDRSVPVFIDSMKHICFKTTQTAFVMVLGNLQ